VVLKTFGSPMMIAVRRLGVAAGTCGRWSFCPVGAAGGAAHAVANSTIPSERDTMADCPRIRNLALQRIPIEEDSRDGRRWEVPAPKSTPEIPSFTRGYLGSTATATRIAENRCIRGQALRDH